MNVNCLLGNGEGERGSFFFVRYCRGVRKLRIERECERGSFGG